MLKLSPIEEIKEKWYLFNEILEENKLSLIYLLMIVINQFAYGISSKILTSTGVDLRHIYGVSQYSIDNLNTPIYVAFLFGSFANYLYKYLNRQLVLVLFVLIISVTIGILPHLEAIWAAYLLMACFGIGSGAWEAGNSMWLLEVWPSRIGAIFQVNQFAYNAGGAFSFLLTAPFIWGESVADERNRSLTTQDRQRTLALPFSLTAYLQSIIPIIFLAFYYVNRYQRRSLSKKIHNHNIDSFRPPVFSTSNRHWKMLLCFTWMTIYLTAELSYVNFFTSMYSLLPNFTAKQLSLINTIFLFAYSVSPLFSAFIAISFRLESIILTNYGLVTFSYLLLYFGIDNVLIVYLGNLFLGLGFGPILPAILAFSEINLQLNERNVSLYTFLCGVAWLVTPFITRSGMTFSPYFLFYYPILCIPLSFFLYCTARWWLFHNTQTFDCYTESQRNNSVSGNKF